MLTGPVLLELLKRRGFSFFAGVPCSCLTPLFNAVLADQELRYVGAANEGDAVAMAAGAQLAGRPSVALFQNSGLGNAVNPLTSLTHCFEIPVLLFPSLRGDPEGKPDEPQHRLMGRITTGMLEQMEIGWEYLPTEPDQAASAVERAVEQMAATSRPYALVIRPGSLAPQPLGERAVHKPLTPCALPPRPEPSSTRNEILRAVQSASFEDLVIATTGFTGRELCALEDRPNQFPMVGSMGCALSLGLGAALCQPRRVIVLDGDGALLMRLGSLATAGFERPANLVHLLLDNQIHESTGGQSTVTHSVDLAAMAAAAGYPRVLRCSSADEVASFLSSRESGLTFLHVPVRPGVPAGLPRPDTQPAEVARRVRGFLA